MIIKTTKRAGPLKSLVRREFYILGGEGRQWEALLRVTHKLRPRVTGAGLSY